MVFAPMFCTQSIKEHNLKANHNQGRCFDVDGISVRNLSKNTIWKQITTCSPACKPYTRLYAIYQRTQSESKSQLANGYVTICISVRNLSKNTIWKQITTNWTTSKPVSCLYAIYQRTQSESKSQLDLMVGEEIFVCTQSIKEHNLKANHNSGGALKRTGQSVRNLSKNTIWKQITTFITGGRLGTSLYAIYQRTQSESKSQLVT